MAALGAICAREKTRTASPGPGPEVHGSNTTAHYEHGESIKVRGHHGAKIELALTYHFWHSYYATLANAAH